MGRGNALSLRERNMKHESKPIRWDVFIPCFIVIGGAALLGIVNNAWLTNP